LARSPNLYSLPRPRQTSCSARAFRTRIDKGIRGAPRAAMVGDMVPAGQRGAAYGLRQALDTIGAFAGPLIAIVLMAILHDNFRLIFWLAVIPGLIRRHGRGMRLVPTMIDAASSRPSK
jgi:hypothetical protein